MGPDQLRGVLEAAALPATTVVLPHSSRSVAVTTVLRREARWVGDVPESFRAVPNKPPLIYQGRPMWAEFILLRLLERAGWSGVWVKNWGGRAFWRDVAAPVSLPPAVGELFGLIERHTGNARGGCWDIFAWHGDDVVFVESKQRAKDALRRSQELWLECAIEQGIPLSSFFVAEWTIESTSRPEPRGG